MDVPAFQPISPMAGLELDPANNGHTHIPPSHTFEDEILMEAFYPPHQGLTSAAPVAVPLFHQSNPPPPEASSPSCDVSSQQLAVLQSLQAQHQFQARQQHYYWQHQQEQHQQQQIPRKSAGIRKKKTEQLKTVYKVPAQNILTVDKWAWRKYGQKPIKGSPFPRNYYRCSSSKGCTARKQVERSITEPEVYVLTYTGDHFHPWPLHRNALAGISRSDHRSCAYSSAHRHDLMSVCHVAISESPSQQLPSPSEEVEEEGLLIPNRKYVDEDMLRGMEELGKWKGTSTTTTSTPNGSDSGSGSQLDGPNFY